MIVSFPLLCDVSSYLVKEGSYLSAYVVSGASIACSMGMSPGSVVATSQQTVLFGGAPVATISDIAPMTNIAPCGMCTSLANPTVASATAAALGVLTPMPCVPAPLGTWLGGSVVTAGGIPCLTNQSTLTCSYGGTISIVLPGQGTVLG